MDAHNKILSSAHVWENNYESKWEDLKVFNACTHRNVKTSLKERFNNGFVNIKMLDCCLQCTLRVSFRSIYQLNSNELHVLINAFKNIIN